MNTKAAVGIVVAIIILVVAFFVLNHPAPPAAFTSPTASSSPVVATTTSTSVPAAHVAPAPSTGTPAPKDGSAPTVTIVKVAAFDTASLVSTSPRPVITGTANVSAVAMVLDNPQGVGIAGTSNIPVVHGKWSFSAPQMLTPGVYTLHLIGGDNVVEAKLTIQQ